MCAAPTVYVLEDELSNLFGHLYRLRELIRANYASDAAFFTAIADMPETRGALWARNIDTHELVTSADLEDAYSDYYTEMYGVLVWAPLDALPTPTKTDLKNGHPAAYAEALAGRPVLDTIRRAFDDLASLYGPA